MHQVWYTVMAVISSVKAVFLWVDSRMPAQDLTDRAEEEIRRE